MRAATAVQQLCKSCRTCFMFYCMFLFTCDRSFSAASQNQPNDLSTFAAPFKDYFPFIQPPVPSFLPLSSRFMFPLFPQWRRSEWRMGVNPGGDGGNRPPPNKNTGARMWVCRVCIEIKFRASKQKIDDWRHCFPFPFRRPQLLNPAIGWEMSSERCISFTAAMCIWDRNQTARA